MFVASSNTRFLNWIEIKVEGVYILYHFKTDNFITVSSPFHRGYPIVFQNNLLNQSNVKTFD
jgi:hypothetical protein